MSYSDIVQATEMFDRTTIEISSSLLREAEQACSDYLECGRAASSDIVLLEIIEQVRRSINDPGVCHREIVLLSDPVEEQQLADILGELPDHLRDDVFPQLHNDHTQWRVQLHDSLGVAQAAAEQLMNAIEDTGADVTLIEINMVDRTTTV